MLIVLFITVGGLFFVPIYYRTYSAAPALLLSGGDSTDVYGYVYQEPFNDTTGEWTPAVNVSVRIFATDELFSEIVLTDSEGRFRSYSSYRSGQVVTLTIEEQRFRAFIPYFAKGSVFLGDFYLESES
ncbi:MAG: hypothetical protein ACFFEA_06330 [Candidatus Thorarchaeota archaeon]